MTSRKSEIDGLRAFAVAPVLIGHAWPALMPSGHFGVDVFFVLSGYLIAGLIWDQVKENRFRLSEFYRRRMLRLMPSFFLVLFATFAASWLFHIPTETRVVMRTGLYSALSASNLYLPGTAGYFSADAALNPLLHTWSLGVEEQFYLVFPLLFLMAWRLGTKPLILLFSSLAVLSLWHSYTLYSAGSPWAHYSPLGRAWELLLGCGLAFAVRTRFGALRDRLSPVTLGVLGYGALAALTGLYFVDLHGHELGGQIAVGMFTAMVLWTTTGAQSSPFVVLRFRVFVGIGLASYALYLWHQPVMAFARLAFPGSTWSFLLGTSVVSLGLAVLSRQLVEEPMRRVKLSLARTLILVIIALGLTGAIFIRSIQTNNFFDRVAKTQGIHVEYPEDQAIARTCSLWGPLKTPAPEFCEFPAQEAAETSPTLAIWGDSHAAALVAGFISLDRPYNLLHLGMSGCVITVDGQFEGSSEDCREKHGAALARILEDASIEVVLLHMKWWISPQKHEFAEKAFSNFAEAIDRLENAGKKVIVVTPVPVFDKEVPGSAWRSARYGVDLTPSKTLEEHLADDGRRTSEVEEIARNAGVEVFDPTSVLCPEGRCSSVDGYLPLYYDDDHLSSSGALRVAREMDVAIGRAFATGIDATLP